ncbi:glycosyltransferase family 1 protein [Aquibium carbonis]|uniref:Glycosyltransferase family 1 protein n=1 Tax=Aquibium carbonis TaxID=2495581 RepID=A0A429YFD8_9HYPH|nr:glycosyltransferase [Aquibium carbonis]RST80104.1 glycosyltransferase family 1 protein [Aquibium carbonis]
MSKRVLFHRSFGRFAGGHLKVFDYFEHTRATEGFEAAIYLTPDSLPANPWADGAAITDRYAPETADILFVAGMDWQALDGFPGIEERKPVISLIQGLRHAAPDTPLYEALGRRAVRICVSAEVAEAILATGRCNGPVHTIPNCLDLAELPAAAEAGRIDVFIAGMKQPDLAAELASRLARHGLSVDCQTKQVERRTFLARMARARIALLLPLAQEGFFLPALEAMAMGCVVICPDCVGNRSFCIDGVNASMPEAEAAAIETAVRQVCRSPDLAARLRRSALATSARHEIATERAAYQTILRRIQS